MFKAGIHIVFQQIYLALRWCVKSQWILLTEVGHFKCYKWGCWHCEEGGLSVTFPLPRAFLENSRETGK